MSATKREAAEMKGTAATAEAEPGDGPRIVYGRNGVPIQIRDSRTSGAGYRTYEIYQRERVGESTEKIAPGQLIAPEFAADPYPTLEILRENYPCYRDWIGNAYWVTRYDDVTSVFVDDANFETRPKSWYYGLESFGRDLWHELPVLFAHERRTDAHAAAVAEKILAELAPRGSADLALEVAARYPLELLARVLDLPEEDFPSFVERYWRMQRGWNWDPRAEQDGLAALHELVDYFRPLVDRRRADPGDDLISAMIEADPYGGPVSAEDVVITLLERDHETLHGGLANMWALLATHPDQLEEVRDNRRLVKYAWLETMRHSQPVLQAHRYARQEVERFGRLLPEGALVVCSAAAANRDPRVFRDPDRFVVGRRDLCQREPRGQYRADGLPAGICFGLGPPSKFPAIPEDRPRSLYAITRDTAVTATDVMLEMLPNLRLGEPGAVMRSLKVGEMHTCWKLPVRFDPR